MNQLQTLEFVLGQPLLPRNLAEAKDLAHDIFESRLCPPGLDTEAKVFICILTGAELGISPMRAVQELAIINNRPTVPGGLALTLVRTSGQLEDWEEGVEGEGDGRHGYCRVKRKGEGRTYESTFSVNDAKRAGLWDTRAKVRRKNRSTGEWYEAVNDQPWFCYPDRMLVMRARGFRLRDSFGDVLGGLYLKEEFEGTTIEGEVIADRPSRPSSDIEPPAPPPEAPGKPVEPPPPPEAAGAPPSPPKPPAASYKAPTHGSPELDADAVKLRAMGQDPSPTLQDLGLEPPSPPPEPMTALVFAGLLKNYEIAAELAMTEEELDELWNDSVLPEEPRFPHEDCLGLLQSIDDTARGRIQNENKDDGHD
jgi:hypothetical protein